MFTGAIMFGTLLYSLQQILKKICDHPLLLTKKAAEGVLEGMDEMLNDQDIGMVEKIAMDLADIAYGDNAHWKLVRMSHANYHSSCLCW
jgi:hypothetical protein